MRIFSARQSRSQSPIELTELRSMLAAVDRSQAVIAIHASPALTTVRQDIGRGARAMVDLLLRRLEGEPAPSLVMAPELVVRASAP